MDAMNYLRRTRRFVIVVLGLSIFNSFLMTPVTSHVGLTFPPARKYDLDFLDNIRTKPPCGMPKGSAKTSLVSGSSINITWHLSYPHQGGYRLELMDSQERQLLDLTPKKGKDEYIRGDPTAQWYDVKLPPDFTCEDCTIRLLREASEWSGNYRFWSCADIDIVEPKQFKENCLGHGRPIAGRCLCNKGFWGNRCQYQDECETEAECSNGNGKCIDLGGTALPKKQCFCNPGFHGEKCSKRNAVKLPDSKKPLELTQHKKRILSDRMTLYYKIIPGKREEDKEIEFVLEIDGTSYGAIGWRPATFTSTCQRWPFIANPPNEREGKSAKLLVNPLKKTEPQPQAEGSEPVAEGEPSAEGEPVAEGEVKESYKKKTGRKESKSEEEPLAEGSSEPEPKSDAEGEPEPEADAEPVPEGETSSGEASSPPSQSNAGKLRSKLKPKAKLSEGTDISLESGSVEVTRGARKQRSPSPESANSEPEPEGEAEPEGEPSAASSEPEPNSEPEGEPEGEPAAEPGSSGSYEHAGDYNPSKLEHHQWTPKSELHAMDCIDLVMGGARGQLSRILDYYTRDRSTPRLDSFWGGKDDITSATGWEQDSKTILIFRRKVRSTDGPDHSLDSGEMHVIWARGQEPGDYVHKPKSGLEAKGHMPSIPNFYARDEIKYHGHGAQRGKTRIDFIEKPAADSKKKDNQNCEDSWSHPPGCSNEEGTTKPCSYIATWKYIHTIDSVQFTIQTRQAQRWTGIGFGDSPTMRNSDVILGWVTPAGRTFLMDAFMSSYQPPSLDQIQNIKNETGTYNEGLVTLSFIRPVQSSDPKDVSLDGCRFFLFPIEGGTFDPVSKRIGKHDQTPLTSPVKICISRKCRITLPKKPDEIRYEFDIKLTGGFANNWVVPIKGTQEFQDFGNRLRRDLESELKSIDGFNSLSLQEVKKVGSEAVAKLELMVKPNSELSEKSRVERALKSTISSGKAGQLQVDPTFLKLSAPEVLSTPTEDETLEGGFFIGTRLWIVIGCVAALIVLALVQAVLTIYKTASKSSSHKDSPSSGSGMAWRDYSETNYGYDPYDEKALHGNGNTIPLTTTPTNHNSNNHHYNGAPTHITNMSLPRPQSQSQSKGGSRHQQQPHHHHHQSNGNGHSHYGNGGTSSSSNHTPNYGHTHNGTLNSNISQNNPDFYFMPSQRKYSGEVVRVYVDHNNKR